MASADLLWLLVRDNNKYLQKRGGIRLSNDPFNNSGKSTKRHAGFIQPKAAVIRVKKQANVQVYVKDGSNPQKPAKQWVKKDVAGNKSGVASATAAAVRPDLADVAFRRAKKLSIGISRLAKVRAQRKANSAKRSASKAFKRTALSAAKQSKKEKKSKKQ